MTGVRKDYSDAEKFRCVVRGVFYRAELEGIYGKILRAAGVSERAIVQRLRARTDFKIQQARDLIELNIADVFKSRPSYYPARFNTESFSAYYTAKDSKTAQAEKLRHVPKGSPCVVFTVTFSGDALDIRPDVSGGRLAFDDDYADCQALAVNSKMAGSKAIAAPSRRNPGSSCCAIFDRGNIRPMEVVEHVESLGS